jgi:hypothetical protein
VVFWPDGRRAEGVNIFLEDPRWPWQVFAVTATTDSQGRFLFHALDGTHYRIHAATSGGPISTEPSSIELGGNRLELKLALIRKGYSQRERDAMREALDNWRKGLGLR